CYECDRQTLDVFSKCLERREPLCFPNEMLRCPLAAQDSTINFSREQSACWGKRRATRMSENVSGAEPRFAPFFAIDLADQKHVWSLQPGDSEKRQQGEIEHTPEAVESWVAMLSRRFGNQAIAVAVEQSRGALVFMLSKYEQLHIYPIHPRAAAQFRAALFP